MSAQVAQITNEQDTPANEAEHQKARLIGWLVSYALNEKGLAHEIRSGRSLITTGKSNDKFTIAVVDKNVSTPHAALSANSKHVVMIQDIFSDHGSFITRGGANGESPITGPTRIKHGDWIRFGSTVFQVCLIDGPSK